MPFDVLVLNSGEWLLGEELLADPWRVLIYKERVEPRNELHLWLPRLSAREPTEFACRRYWVDGSTRWCVEVPRDPDRLARTGAERALLRVRFTSPDGVVLWAEYRGPWRLADFTNDDLDRLRQSAEPGPFTAI